MRAVRPVLVLLAVATGACVLPARAADFDCVIEPREIIELRAPIEGLIEKVNVDRGDNVRRGQDLVVLDAAVDRAAAAIARHRSVMDGAVRSGETRVEFSTAKVKRQKSLEENNFVSAQAREEAVTEQQLAQSELQDAKDNRKLAELELARQQEVIRMKTIRSPIDGVVVERLLNVGEFAEAGVGRKPILKLAEIDTLYVEVLMPVEAYGQVKAGMDAQVLPEIPAGARYTGHVKVIDRIVDAASGTFGVRLELANPQRRMPAGIRCKAQFTGIDVKPQRAAAHKAPAG
ncbi:efflux RND transporter periplasmic adaptor subunit [Ramlibacter sp. G-1-2-2]|uniref:Efflux RND transporter periplasmic adaptor subunit n=1 Tax=Ramlibacter agri TaxID=2728837 RepID=A0A848HF11_9BURK|nr:efflux RND transporter periplasmic adaptor subunit [Ramlibacter agri]NML48049.1 efflux RND transporter periplasmic adaptor subunit [Ramlibacter agri]